MLDDSFEVERGLRIGRELLKEILSIGLPTATEALDPITPQYLQDLISWSAIGARTTESQTHREMASGLSSSVGFKNGTDGGLEVAINALQSVANPHRFLGINSDGKVSVFETKGNRYGHVVLRGGSNGPNYSQEHIAQCEAALDQADLNANIMVDCSHANSEKKPALQPAVAQNVIQQIIDGNRSIIGLMLESNLEAGNQKIPADLSELRYGVSVTDGCIDWETTESLLLDIASRVAPALTARVPE
jgi:3-deoxy-7-phosphoheptulonate synthase